jgi:hypothetical protein
MIEKYVIVASVITIIIILSVFYVIGQEGKIQIDPEFTGVMMLEGGYRSWYISISDGVVMSDPPKRIWTWPRFHHCDVRPILNESKKRPIEDKKEMLIPNDEIRDLAVICIEYGYKSGIHGDSLSETLDPVTNYISVGRTRE